MAAHPRDIAGAFGAGCGDAFVDRPGQGLDPSGRQPDISGANLREAADRILTGDGPR